MIEKIIEKLKVLATHLQTPEEDKDLVSAIYSHFKTNRDIFVSKRFSPGSTICARLKAFQRIEGFHLNFQEMEIDKVLLFEVGTAIHKKLQNEVLPSLGKSWGSWVCPSCGETKSLQFKPSHPCSNQISISMFGETHETTSCDKLPHKGNWLYKEVYVKASPFNNPLYETSAYIDHVYVDQDYWYILEIKSVYDSIFAGYSTSRHPTNPDWKIQKPWTGGLPKEANIRQAQICGSLLKKTLKDSDLPAPASKYGGVILLYINRDNLNIKTFKFPPDESYYLSLENVIDNTKAAVDKGNAMLAAPACSARTAMLAKICPKRDVCFPLKRKKVQK